MAALILVTGGTGTLGRLVVAELRDRGADVRILSRHGHAPAPGIEYVVGDLATGAGVDTAVDGVATIVHCAGSARGDEEKARTLVRAVAKTGGSPHVVNISVVGADRVPVVSRVDRMMFGYFAAKRAAEEVIATSGLPWTTLRATQFHDLVLMVVRQMTRLPIVPVPAGVRAQPVDAGEVAQRLVQIATAGPAGLVPEMAGPRVYAMADLVREYLRATRRHRLLVPLRLFGTGMRAVRAGAILAPDRAVGRITWEDFLAQRMRTSEARNALGARTGMV